MSNNVLYEIKPDEIKASIDHNIAEIERHRLREAENQNNPNIKPWDYNVYYDECVRKERDHYSTVKIVKFGSRKYKLCYGGDYSQGTGAFPSIKQAKLWFTGHGR